jgi:dTDP-4-dehydrorhamnose reductase
LFRSREIPFKALQRTETDYTDQAVLLETLRRGRPEFLINVAGFTGKPNVDACETRKAECLAANAVLPGRIAEACAAAGVPWGHVSSGCIYNGPGGTGDGYREEDPPNFTFRAGGGSFYSGTKALGEEVLTGYPEVFIWRPRMPFSHLDNPRNYLSKLMRYDQLLDAANSISELHEFVTATFACWEKRAPFGTYHCTNLGHITTREVTDLIKASGICPKEFVFFRDETEFMRLAAKTPRSNCLLDSSKLARAGIVMTEVHEAVARALRNWQKSPA